MLVLVPYWSYGTSGVRIGGMMYWISFASDQGFLGAVIAEGSSPEDAVGQVSQLKLNPGGQAMIVEIPTVRYRHHAWPYRNRLLQKDEIERVFGEKADPHQVQEAAGDRCTILCDDCNDAKLQGAANPVPHKTHHIH